MRSFRAAHAAGRRPIPQNRNGGRHCCQPPLRRAKDLPVFMVLIPKDRFLEIQVHQLRRRFPSDNSLRRGDRPFTRLRHPRVRLSFNYRCLAEPKPSDVPRPFLGRPLLRLALLLPSEDFRSRVAQEEDQLFRRLFPTGPELLRKVSQLPVGGDRSFHPLRFLLSLAGLPVEAGTSVPITLEQCTSPPSRGSEKCCSKPVDNGEIGNNRTTLPSRHNLFLLRPRIALELRH